MKNVQEILAEAKLDFAVEKQPTFIFTKDMEVKDTGMYGLVNQNTNETYATVSDQYEILQNEQLAELTLRLAEQIGAKSVYARGYKGGKKSSLNIVEKETIIEYAQVGDIIESGINITNVHGGGSIKVSNQSLVLSCTNGMTRALKDVTATVRHSKNMVHMLEQLLFINDKAEVEQLTMMEEIERMMNTEVQANDVSRMIHEIMNVDTRKITALGTSVDYSNKKVEQTKSLLDSIKEEMEYKGTTAWGLLNGVTHYTTHKAGSDKSREDSKIFGSLAKADNKAYDFAMSLV